MIYNQKQAIFVALAGLLTSATAAPAHHAKNGHTSELIAPGEKPGPVGLAGRIDKSKYPAACHEAWDLFTQERCWCFTGCALDCSDGRSPGSPGKTMHPEWCEGLTDNDKEACKEFTCDLVDNCDEVDDDLAPGLDKIVSTGGYTCPTEAPSGATGGTDWAITDYQFCALLDPLPDDIPTVRGSKLVVYIDDKKAYDLTLGYSFSYSHSKASGYLICPDSSYPGYPAAKATILDMLGWSEFPAGHATWFTSTAKGQAAISRVSIAAA